MKFPFLFASYEPESGVMDQLDVQSSCSFRSLQRATKLAKVLVNPDGKIDREVLDAAREELTQQRFCLRPLREKDVMRIDHLLTCLEHLDNPQVRHCVEQIMPPEPQNSVALALFQRFFAQHDTPTFSTQHARILVLSAFFHLLRQSVGSCFATAVCLIVQQEQPIQFFTDMHDLLSKGKMTRTFAEKLHIVPLSTSSGVGDLAKVLCLTPHTLDLIHQDTSFAHAWNAMEMEPPELQSHSLPGAMRIEDLLARCLQRECQISSEMIERFLQRPKPIIFGGMLSQTDFTQDAPVQDYFRRLHLGKQAFMDRVEHPLLKAWEFTVASFAEAQGQFVKGNLYTSLGLDPSALGGVGEVVIAVLESLLEEVQQRVQKFHEEYEHSFRELEQLGNRAKHLETERQGRQLKAEYQSKQNTVRTLQQLRDEAQAKGQRLSHVYSFLMDQAFELFPHYFQEVYDPNIRQESQNPYDDSPAGFHLVYKHGRDSPKLWTVIDTKEQFIDALVLFFQALELHVQDTIEIQGIEKEVNLLLSHASRHVQTDLFFSTSLERMNQFRSSGGYPTQKPWVYTSGGTMNTLVQHYYQTQELPKDHSTWVESPQELLVFFLDEMKRFQYDQIKQHLESRTHTYLMHSPTHAFRLLGKKPSFRKGWDHQMFTWTVVRDEMMKPSQDFYASHRLDRSMIRVLMNCCSLREQEAVPLSLSCQECFDFFRSLNASLSPHVFESILFSHFPFFRKNTLLEILEQRQLPLPQDLDDVIGLQKGLDLLMHSLWQKTPFSSQDLQTELLESLIETQRIPPLPIVFADTNWEQELFAFLVSPLTGNLDFWVVTDRRFEGFPMSSWNPYLHGQRPSPRWGLYYDKMDYSYL